MAYGTTLKFGEQSLLLGDGASSETFAAPCGLTQISLTTNVETNTVTNPDCTDPDLPAQVITTEISRAKSASFSGLLVKESLPDWQDWDNAGGEKNVRWLVDLPAADGGGHYEGAALLTAFERTADQGNRWQVSGTITWVTTPAWTDAS